MRTLWLFCLFFSFSLFSGNFFSEPKIEWYSSLEEAQSVAKKEKKNLFLYFTGSDWCPWCSKMRAEILENKAFQKMADPYFIFVLVDFPKAGYLTPQERERNNELRKKYDIEGFPTVVLLDSDLAFISVLGYLPTTGQKYAKHLKKIVAEYHELASIDLDSLSFRERQKIYEKAKSLGCVDCEETEEMAKTKNKVSENDFLNDPFALLDEYNLLKYQFAEGVLTSDGGKLKEILVDYAKNLQDGKTEKALAPLLDYIRTFGSKDKEHLWQIEMIVAQFFYRQGDVQKALVHAKACYKAAPVMLRKDLAEIILFMKHQIKGR